MSAKFTGKERDGETGLDYFGARYFSSVEGRFTSPDEFKGGFDDLDGNAAFALGPIPYADINDAQTFNKYAYVRNNPLRYIDPDGHCPWCIGALIGGVGGAAASAISQKWSHPDRDLNWKQIGAAALGGAVAGGTLGLATAPSALVTVLGGETVLETGAAVGTGAAAGAGVLGGVTERAIDSGGDPNIAIGTPDQILTDAAAGAAAQGVTSTVIDPLVKVSTTAGRAVAVGEAKLARGVRASPSLAQRQGQLTIQQKAASGAVGAGIDATNRTAQQLREKGKEKEQ